MEQQNFTEEQLEQMLAKKKKEKRQARQQALRNYEAKKNKFIASICQAFVQVQSDLTEMKQEALSIGSDLHQEMYKVYEKPVKPQAQFTLEHEDGNLKVVIENQERQSFNEQAEVHINTIKDILREKFSARNKSMYEIIDAILMKNRKGDYDEKLVAKLNKHRDAVKDERFNEALDLLATCYQTYDSATYIRAYQKNSKTNSWENINIQFSSL